MISQATLDAIRDRSNIVELIGEVVSLKRQGTNHVGLCPFHAEKTPSFQVREHEGYYHCFGCGVSGSVIDFVMRMRGLSFPEAVEELAGRLGIEVKREGETSGSISGANKQALYKVNRYAFEFFKGALAKAPPGVREYVMSRGITDRAIETFGIGFAPKSWHGLREYLSAKKVDEAMVASSGLVRRSAKGDLYDTFRGRLVFPVWVDDKKIAGFGARTIPCLEDPDSTSTSPKYLNSPETAVYQKSKVLYGLPQAIEPIRRKGSVYLVEGYMDVVGLWQAGVENVVATCGTALTPGHVRRLSRMTEKVLVVFDGDTAGRTASGKSFSVFLNSGIDALAVFLPPDEDPDSIATKKGKGAEDFLHNAPKSPLLECYINHLVEKFGFVDIKDMGAASKGKLCEELASTLREVSNSVEQSELLQRATLKLMVETSSLNDLVASGTRRNEPRVEKQTLSTVMGSTPQVSGGEIGFRKKAVSELPVIDRELLRAIMARREMSCDVLSDPDLCLSLDSSTRSFIEGLQKIVQSRDEESSLQKEKIRILLRDFGPSWLAHWRESHAMAEDRAINMQEIYRQCCEKVKKNKLIQLVRELEKTIVSRTEPNEKLQLIQEKLILTRKLNEWR